MKKKDIWGYNRTLSTDANRLSISLGFLFK